MAPGPPPPLPIAPAQPPRLVARADELGRLGGYLDAALAGNTEVAFVSGDAGSGKTALLEAFAGAAMAEQPELLVAGARCSPGDQLNPFAPLRKLGAMLFGDAASGMAWRLAGGEQVTRLQRSAGLALSALREHGPGLVNALLAATSTARRAWLAEPVQGAQSPIPLSQDALLGQLLGTLAAIAGAQPLLLLFDDLHWVDDASAAFLLRLGRELSGSRLLVLGAYRSATVALGRRDPRSGEVSRHPLASVINELRRCAGEILVELDRADGRAFVEAYVDTEPNRLGAQFRDALYAHTGGHALFTVETLRHLQERGGIVQDEAGRWVAHEKLDWGALPARVEAAIAERVELLPEAERRILSCASVQGDDFSAEIVAGSAGMPAGDAIARLSGNLARQHRLVRPEGVQQLGSGRHSIYRFTHHLLQKYLYDSLDPVERVRLHGALATALDRELGGDQVAGQMAAHEHGGARLAWHYEAADMPLEAARALLDAGRHAMGVAAFPEALGHYDHGLGLLAQTPPSPQRTELERQLEVARLSPLRQLEGAAGAGLQGTLARASAAWAGHPEGRARLVLLSAETEHLMVTGQFASALAAAEHLRAEAERRADDEVATLAQAYFGMIHHHVGHPQPSEAFVAPILEGFTAEAAARLRAATGIDLPANVFGYSALNLWFLGYPEAALRRSKQAIAGARAAGAAVGQAAALVLGANLLFLLRTGEADGAGAIAEQGEDARRLCLDHGIGMWRVFAEVLLGRLMVLRGDDFAGVERMRGAIAEWRNMGLTLATSCYSMLLAGGCLAAAGRRPGGDPARARLLATGLEAIDSIWGPPAVPCGQCYDPELHRLRGELLLARDGLVAAGEALGCFQQALQLGQERGALAWELRAAVSLVRLRQRQGDAWAKELAKAREVLREICARFTEGFAFPDLLDAAALTENHPV